jgi:hypothetical protein
MQSKDWKTYERHPLSAEYLDIGGRAWDAYLQNFRKHGIQNKRRVMTWEGKVVDGWQMFRACIECDIRPEFAEVKLAEGQTIEEWVETVNDHRRHESYEKIAERAAARRERVARARAEGQSLRSIAEQEAVSESTIRNDLSGEQGCSPEAVVKGKDGKTYAAGKPVILCGRCQRVGPTPKCDMCRLERLATRKGKQPGDDSPRKRGAGPKNGSVKYDRKPLKACWGQLVREVDKLGNAYGKKETPDAEGLRRRLTEWLKDYKEWYRKLAGAKAPEGV